jgi:uncharacterized membrane protein
VTSHRDLTAASLAALVCAAVAVAVPVEPIRVIAAVPLALALPGYAATMASFGRRAPDGPTLLMLTAGLSLSVLILGAVALHLLPGRFGEASWALLLVATTLGGCAIAAARRGAPSPGEAAWRLRSLPRPGRADAALLAGAAVAVAATAILAATVLPARDALGYTRLWMLPSELGATTPHVRVGVVNQEQEAVVYRLALRIGGRRTIRRMELEPGEQRIWRVTPRSADPGNAIPVTGRLFRADDPFAVYRRVNGWIPVP